MRKLLAWLLWLWLSAVIVGAFLYAPLAKGFIGQSSRILFFHVPMAWVSFVAFIAGGIWSLLFLFRGRRPKDDRAAGCDSVVIRGGRKAAQAPALVVPATAPDPGRCRPSGGVAAQRLLRFRQAPGCRKVERKRTLAERHDMTMAVDQAGNEGAPTGVEAEIEPFGRLVATPEQFCDLAIGADQQAREPGEFAVVVDRVAIGIIDQPIGVGWPCKAYEDKCQAFPRWRTWREDAPHAFGSRFTTEEMSSRPQPSAWASA